MKKIFSSAKELFHYIVASLDIYDPREASAVAFRILEYFGISKADVLSGRQEDFIHGEQLHKFIDRLNQHEPLQYVLEEADFYGNKFYVNPSVLIPRPETEELVKLIVDENNNQKNLKIIDIGTGSGCIAVSLAHELPGTEVHALDVSKAAIKIAEQNAKSNFVKLNFHHYDITQYSGNDLPVFDLIVSNPPYVRESEKKEMNKNVLEFEPSLALYVPDEDPLLFYRSILKFSENNLKENGRCYFEINEYLGREMEKLMLEHGFYDVKIISDLHEKHRFIAGKKTKRS